MHRSFVRSLALDTLKPEEVRARVRVRVRFSVRVRVRVRVIRVRVSSAPSSRRRHAWTASSNPDPNAQIEPCILVARTVTLTRCASSYSAATPGCTRT